MTDTFTMDETQIPPSFTYSPSYQRGYMYGMLYNFMGFLDSFHDFKFSRAKINKLQIDIDKYKQIMLLYVKFVIDYFTTKQINISNNIFFNTNINFSGKILTLNSLIKMFLKNVDIHLINTCIERFDDGNVKCKIYYPLICKMFKSNSKTTCNNKIQNNPDAISVFNKQINEKKSCTDLSTRFFIYPNMKIVDSCDATNGDFKLMNVYVHGKSNIEGGIDPGSASRTPGTYIKKQHVPFRKKDGAFFGINPSSDYKIEIFGCTFFTTNEIQLIPIIKRKKHSPTPSTATKTITTITAIHDITTIKLVCKKKASVPQCWKSLLILIGTIDNLQFNKLPDSIVPIDCIFDITEKKIYDDLQIILKLKIKDILEIKEQLKSIYITLCFGVKRFGDWYQAVLARLYNVFLSSNDRYSHLFGLICGAPSWIDKVLPTQHDNHIKGPSTQVHLYNIDICNSTRQFVAFNKKNEHVDISKPSGELILDSTIPNHPTGKIKISASNTRFYFKKYIKYKYKYLKLKLKYNEEYMYGGSKNKTPDEGMTDETTIDEAMTYKTTIDEDMTYKTNGQPRINKRQRKDDDEVGKPSKSQDIMIISRIETKLNEMYQLYEKITIIETHKNFENHDIIDKMAQEVRDIFSYDEFVKNFNNSNSDSVSEYIYVKSMLSSAEEITNDELYNKLYTLYIFLNNNNVLLLKNLLTNINLMKIKNIQDNFHHIKIEQLEQLKELVELTENKISEHMHPELDYECLSDIDN